MTSTTSTIGSAERQAVLWGARPEDWAENEAQQAPAYEEAIRRAGISPGQRVLDLGCGSGVFLRAAADRGAKVFGLDAASTLIEIAGDRVPEADLRVGDLQFLPYDDDYFDVVAGFNSFFFAADMTEAIREAARVAKPSAPLVIQVWGRPERCDLTALLRAVGPLRPAPAPGAPPRLSQPGVLESIVAEAGLTAQTAFDVSYALEYPDEQTLVRGMLSSGAVVEAIQTSGEEAVTKVVVESLAPYHRRGGGYRLENEWHYLLARA